MRQCLTTLFLCLAILPLAIARGGAGETVTFARWRNADPATAAYVLALARRAFDAYVTQRQTIAAPSDTPPLLRTRAGVFVSAMRDFAPRCCMGSLYPMESDVSHEIIRCADAAAGHDLRFPPIKVSELSSLTLIVSVLDTPQAISASEARRLDPTTTGLMAQCGGQCGVVLSGETHSRQRMIDWARIRAGADDSSSVQYFAIHDVRFVEGRNGVLQ